MYQSFNYVNIMSIEAVPEVHDRHKLGHFRSIYQQCGRQGKSS
jgi:hypothetical protein